MIVCICASTTRSPFDWTRWSSLRAFNLTNYQQSEAIYVYANSQHYPLGTCKCASGSELVHIYTFLQFERNAPQGILLRTYISHPGLSGLWLLKYTAWHPVILFQPNKKRCVLPRTPSASHHHRICCTKTTWEPRRSTEDRSHSTKPYGVRCSIAWKAVTFYFVCLVSIYIQNQYELKWKTLHRRRNVSTEPLCSLINDDRVRCWSINTNVFWSNSEFTLTILNNIEYKTYLFYIYSIFFALENGNSDDLPHLFRV